MQKSEDVVIPMNKNKIRYLVGSEKLEIKPLLIYSDIVCAFLDELSKELRSDAEAKAYPDVLTFAFWCRRANITKLKEAYHTSNMRVAKGLVFHIAPSNVPINFAFSLVFGMLSGNGNVVRVSEKDFPQTNIVCRIMNKILENPVYNVIREQTQVVSYGHIKEINDYYSAKCDMRVIWGGDNTIEEIRRSPISTRCTEVTFADRYSFAVFDGRIMDELSEEEMRRLAEGFFNDTYLMDQNACSSPHLILWKNSDARDKFWKTLLQTAQKYELPEKKVLDKYTILCEKVAQIEELESVERYSNLLYIVKLSRLPDDITQLRGKFGLFYEAEINNYEEITTKLSTKVQTCVTCGVDKQELLRVFVDNHVKGVDRIVSVGEAMNMGVYWDGYDIIGSFSREIVMS